MSSGRRPRSPPSKRPANQRLPLVSASPPSRRLPKSRSAPTLDLRPLLRAAQLYHNNSYDVLSQLIERASDHELGSVMSEVEMLMDKLSDTGTDEEADENSSDDSEDLLTSVALPFCGNYATRKRKKKFSRKPSSVDSSSPAKRQRRQPTVAQDRNKRKRGSPKRRRLSAEGSENMRFLVPPIRSPHAMSLVLDVDETIVFARGTELVVRPYLAELIAICMSSRCEVILWTAAAPSHATTVLQCINREFQSHSWYHHVITRSPSWFNEDHGVAKDLRCLGGRSLRRIVIVENNPASCQIQPENAVLVEDFNGSRDWKDLTLQVLSSLIEVVARELGTPRHPAYDGDEDDDEDDSMETRPSVASILGRSDLVTPLTFFLSAEYCCDRVAKKIVCRGLRYRPRESDARCYAGISPEVGGSISIEPVSHSGHPNLA